MCFESATAGPARTYGQMLNYRNSPDLFSPRLPIFGILRLIGREPLTFCGYTFCVVVGFGSRSPGRVGRFLSLGVVCPSSRFCPRRFGGGKAQDFGSRRTFPGTSPRETRRPGATAWAEPWPPAKRQREAKNLPTLPGCRRFARRVAFVSPARTTYGLPRNPR
jgi:hypothetical protein